MLSIRPHAPPLNYMLYVFMDASSLPSDFDHKADAFLTYLQTFDYASLLQTAWPTLHALSDYILSSNVRTVHLRTMCKHFVKLIQALSVATTQAVLQRTCSPKDQSQLLQELQSTFSETLHVCRHELSSIDPSTLVEHDQYIHSVLLHFLYYLGT